MIAEQGVPALIVEENALKGRQAGHIYGLRDDYERRLTPGWWRARPAAAPRRG